MSGKTLVDTNILIYAYDLDEGPKHRIARDLLADIMASRRGFLSPQVLQEFYVNATRKMARPLTKAEARRKVRWTVTLVVALREQSICCQWICAKVRCDPVRWKFCDSNRIIDPDALYAELLWKAIAE